MTIDVSLELEDFIILKNLLLAIKDLSKLKINEVFDLPQIGTKEACNSMLENVYPQLYKLMQLEHDKDTAMLIDEIEYLLSR